METQGLLFGDYVKQAPSVVRKAIKTIFDDLTLDHRKSVVEVLTFYKQVGSFYRPNTGRARNNVGFWLLYGYSEGVLVEAIKIYLAFLQEIRHAPRYRIASRNFFYVVEPPFVEFLERKMAEEQEAAPQLSDSVLQARSHRECFLKQFADAPRRKLA